MTDEETTIEGKKGDKIELKGNLLEIKVFDASIEIKAPGNTSSISVERVNFEGDENAPEDAVYKISFYRRKGAARSDLPGTIYVGHKGALIKGARIFPGTDETYISFKERIPL